MTNENMTSGNKRGASYPLQGDQFHIISRIRNDERAELERKAAQLDALLKNMPCGHAGRYAYGNVTMNCALCQLDAMQERLTKRPKQAYNRRK